MTKYMPVPVDVDDGDDEARFHYKPHRNLEYHSREQGRKWMRKERILTVALLIQTFGMFILVSFLLKSGNQCSSPTTEDLTRTSLLHKYGQMYYCELCNLLRASGFDTMTLAPAQSALELEAKVFGMSFSTEELTVYEGRGEETDRAWGDLYNRKVSCRYSFTLDTD
jgi:hypothetical protein